MVNQTEPLEFDTCQVKMIHHHRVDRARAEAIEGPLLDRLSLLFKVLGDPTRLRLVLALAGGEMCVCDLAAYLGVSDSAVSHQLRRLREQALVKARRDGQIIYYSLDDDHVSGLLNMGLEHVKE